MGEAEARQLIETISKTNRFKKQVRAFLPILSLLVILSVFWWLKTTAITLAGDAFCGMEEHKHSEECENTLCELEEHIHKATCYSDMQADLEAKETWESTFKDVPTNIHSYEKLVLIAQTQKGYKESERNFIISETGERVGCTRYGQWYGNPYGEWSTMFTSFCLYYSSIDVPLSSGADAMRLQWKEKGIYQPSSKYSPILGDIVFFDRNQNGQADSTGIVVALSQKEIVVIEGDFENEVRENVYPLKDDSILGYGLSTPKNSLIIIEDSSDLEVDILGAGAPFAKHVTYNQNLFTNQNSFVLYTQKGSEYYAFDGNGNAVRIYIDSSGNITTDSTNTDALLWTFTYSSANTYYIQNISTGRYMHAHSTGVTTSGRYTSLLEKSGSGVRVKSNSEYAKLNNAATAFEMTRTQSSAAVYYFGMTSRCTVWLDGTNGHLMGIDGSLDKSYSVSVGDVLKLPTEWQTPAKYNYVLKGWYDITNSKYYAPGEEVTVTGNAVFYADWVAATYDIGQYNALVTNTVSTNDFITTKVFDYGYLFNVMSSNPTITVDAAGHSETWNLVTSGIVAYENRNTLNYIFRDWDSNGKFSYPRNTNNANTNGSVNAGLYTDYLGDLLFNPDTAYDPVSKTGVIGKNYLGTADHLFQIETDPSNPNYGYYYYDSSLNAASYNQSDKRFYVYDYLERTSDSAKASGEGKNSDFIPLNSPYVNTNGKNVVTYTYDGENGEYQGTTHYMYDAKYNSEGSSQNNATTNFLFGMSIDIEFYLPESPGSRDADGNYGNQDLYGKDMHFKFSGDDDVWVFVDGKLVLDIGGIHGIESGDINFSTGVVMVNGTQTGTITDLKEGEHTLTIYYLERGSSQSNCAIYFNLAPRFSFSIQKEDVLTKDVLNGAEFSVFTDKACTVPATLWESEASYENGDVATNVFTVKNGVANIWGLSAGKTYYIKETKPPDAAGYGFANGIICVTLNKAGVASYSVEIIDEEQATVSNGFTVHGFRIDEETQKAYIVATNAPSWVKETTTVKAYKKWGDNLDHTADSVTVYLTVTDKDGTVRRLQEIELSEENDWTHTWTNLPKYYEDGTEVIYGVEEAYKSGYSPTIEKVDKIVISTEAWNSSNTFQNGKVYILNTNSGYISSAGEESNGFMFVSESVAKSSPLARWTATVSGNTVKLTNEAGQIITCQYNRTGTYFYLTKSSTNYQSLNFATSNSGISLSLYYNRSYYYWSGLNSNGTGSYTSRSSGAMFLKPAEKVGEEKVEDVTGFAYEITNVPLKVETSLKVTKFWDLGMASSVDYQKAQVTIKLFANGKDTGRTITLSLKNNWSDSFLGLPYTDEAGNVILYSIEESWETEDWSPTYGEVVTINDGNVPRYETTVTNHYVHGRGFELPSTGSYGYLICIWSGFAIMLFALCLAISSRFISVYKIKKEK